MNQIIEFAIPQIKIHHPLLSLKGFEAISKPFQFYLTFQASIETNDEILIGKIGQLLFKDQTNTQRIINGIIIKSGIKGYSSSKDKIVFVVLMPRFSLLKNFINARVFLNKSVIDIAQELLITHAGYLKSQITLFLKHQYPILPFCMQPPEESDFDFINRLLTKNGIYYFFITKNDFEKIILCDNNLFLSKRKTTLNYYAKQNWQNTHAIYHLSIKHNLVTNTFSIRDYNDNSPNISIEQKTDAFNNSSNNKTHFDIFGTGANDNTEAQKLAENHRQYARNKAFHIQFDSHNLDLCSGKIVSIDTKIFNQRYSGHYLLTEINHFYQAPTHHFSDGQAIPYRNHCKTIISTTKFQAKMVDHPAMPPYLSARIESDSHFPHLDEYGRYQIRFIFDRSNKPNTQASIPIRHLHYYAGPVSNNDTNDNLTGWHFPLHDGTEVLIGFFNGNPDKPFIAGNLPNSDSISPVTSQNLKQNRIVTKAGNELLFDDHNQTQKIIFSTPNKENFLQINSNPKNQNISLTSKKGDINFYAQENYQEETDANSITIVNQQAEYQIQNDHKIKTHHGDIHYQAKKQIEFNAKQNIKITSKKNIELSANHELLLKSNNNLSIISTATTLQSKTDKLCLNANHIGIESKGNIHITNGSAGILLTPAGHITVYGSTISGNLGYSSKLNQSPSPCGFPLKPNNVEIEKNAPIKEIIPQHTKVD